MFSNKMDTWHGLVPFGIRHLQFERMPEKNLYCWNILKDMLRIVHARKLCYSFGRCNTRG